jgi:hypothetical protein
MASSEAEFHPRGRPASSEAEFHPRGSPALERGGLSSEGASRPRARRSFSGTATGPSSETETRSRGRWGRPFDGPLGLPGP